MLTGPTTFAGARDYLSKRAVLPLGLSSRDISLKVPEQIRAQAFFSAKVASADILANFKTLAERYAAGEIGLAEARLGMKQFLAKQGIGIPDPEEGADKDVRKLGSTARIELVIRQNAAMANARAQRAIGELPAVMDFLPNYRFVANTDRHEKLNGLTAPKKSPVWRTKFPPLDFRCDCSAEDTADAPTLESARLRRTADGQDIGTLRLRGGKTIDLQPNESGYAFDSSAQANPADALQRVEDPELRAVIRKMAGKRGLLKIVEDSGKNNPGDVAE